MEGERGGGGREEGEREVERGVTGKRKAEVRRINPAAEG